MTPVPSSLDLNTSSTTDLRDAQSGFSQGVALTTAEMPSSTSFQHDLDCAVDAVRQSLLSTVTSTTSEILGELAAYYASRPSKQMRPRLVLLLAQATATEFSPISRKHLCLAEIVEMIHVASLLHDDVLDNAATRRGDISAPAKYGNKSTVLTGDFLLAKLMTLAVSLGNWEVAQEIPEMIGELIEGELRQAEGAHDALRAAGTLIQGTNYDILWANYINRIYLKTGTLFARSGKCSVLLHKDISQDVIDSAYEYGRNLGIAFQIVDDILDFTGDECLGKPHGNDLRDGIITAPVLFALEESADMQDIFSRGFSQPGDIDKAICIVNSTQALQRSEQMAVEYAERACLSISNLKSSSAKTALEALSKWITVRRH
ncbi:hypothetical protein VKT23_012941 [Stygiomarasmius scandens]|uniref:(2E,6E)-farnesyl diphosphate synthase n=1 Tax=Marasmiellus scandens TaxID=2682957 RepID=A0ABR1J598_9AGAR